MILRYRNIVAFEDYNSRRRWPPEVLAKAFDMKHIMSVLDINSSLASLREAITRD